MIALSSPCAPVACPHLQYIIFKRCTSVQKSTMERSSRRKTTMPWFSWKQPCHVFCCKNVGWRSDHALISVQTAIDGNTWVSNTPTGCLSPTALNFYYIVRPRGARFFFSFRSPREQPWIYCYNVLTSSTVSCVSDKDPPGRYICHAPPECLLNQKNKPLTFSTLQKTTRVCKADTPL